MRFAGQYARVKASGAPVVFLDEATTDSGDHKTYQITAAAKQVWDRVAVITVKVDGVAAAAGSYTLDRLFGRVTFAAAQDPAAVVTASGSYLPTSIVAGANSAEHTLSKDTLDATTFENQGFIERESGMGDASGSIGRFYQVDALFVDSVTAGDVIVVEFWRNKATLDWRAWGLIEKDDVKAAVADLINESVDWSGAADVDGRSVSYA